MKSINEIDAMAVTLRRELGEDFLSPIDIFSLVKTMNNLTVVLYPLGNNISGMCIKEGRANLIAINSGMSLGRQRFSMAHELYHLKYDTAVKKSVSSMTIDSGDDNEKEADLFASHFLLPSSALYSHLKDSDCASPEQIVWLEQYYGLSRQAMLYRLKSEGKINNNLYKRMQSNVINTASRLGYDTDLYKKTNRMVTTGQYIRLADKLHEDDVISTGKYEEMLLDAFREDLVYGEDMEDEIFD